MKADKTLSTAIGFVTLTRNIHSGLVMCYVILVYLSCPITQVQ